MNETDAALMGKALGDRSRVQIVGMLASGEMCACKLLERFAITQPTLSHHMKILCASGLVAVRRDGKWCHYSLRRETLEAYEAFLAGLTQADNGGCCDGR